MVIPEKVKVGGIVYKVILADNWFESDGSDGETFYNRRIGNIIYINSELSPEAQGVALIHECLHCANSTLDHVALDSLAEQLYQILHDNKLRF